MNALITGVSGFVGAHLTELLAAFRHQVLGLDLQRRPRVARLEAEGKCRFVLGAVDDPERIRALVTDENVDVVFHLAGVHGARPALDLYRANVLGTAALLEGLSAARRPVRTLIVGSSAAYGAPVGAAPIDETAAFRPLTPYGVSKAAADLMGFQCHAATGLPVIRVRPFNIIGPGQDGAFLLPTVARQVAEIEGGRQPPVVKLGDLSGHRDFLDVRDVVRALAELAERGLPGEAYNVCSATATPVRAAVEQLVALAKTPVQIESDPGRIAGANVAHQVGSHAKLTELSGWQPRIALAQSLAEVLEDWRSQEQSS